MMRRRQRHLCLPPTGVVFESTWQCPECGNRWRIVEHANDTEWLPLAAASDGGSDERN